MSGDGRADLVPSSPIGRIFEEALRFARKGVARIIEFSPSRLNFSWITDSLAVGGAFHTSDIPRLRALGVNAVVDCRAEASDDKDALRKHGIEFLWLPAPDTHEITQDSLEKGVAWARSHIEDGRKVYVHCLHGVGRGPLLGACILVSGGLSAREAIDLVRTNRWQASPNEEQLNAVVTYADRVQSASVLSPPPRAGEG